MSETDFIFLRIELYESVDLCVCSLSAGRFLDFIRKIGKSDDEDRRGRVGDQYKLSLGGAPDTEE